MLDWQPETRAKDTWAEDARAVDARAGPESLRKMDTRAAQSNRVVQCAVTKKLL